MIFRYINLYIFCIMYATILIYLLSCSVVCKMLPGLILFLSCTYTSHSQSAWIVQRMKKNYSTSFDYRCIFTSNAADKHGSVKTIICGYNMLVYMARLSTLASCAWCSVRFDWEGVVLLCRYTYVRVQVIDAAEHIYFYMYSWSP